MAQVKGTGKCLLKAKNMFTKFTQNTDETEYHLVNGERLENDKCAEIKLNLLTAAINFQVRKFSKFLKISLSTNSKFLK